MADSIPGCRWRSTKLYRRVLLLVFGLFRTGLRKTGTLYDLGQLNLVGWAMKSAIKGSAANAAIQARL